MRYADWQNEVYETLFNAHGIEKNDVLGFMLVNAYSRFPEDPVEASEFIFKYVRAGITNSRPKAF